MFRNFEYACVELKNSDRHERNKTGSQHDCILTLAQADRMVTERTEPGCILYLCSTFGSN